MLIQKGNSNRFNEWAEKMIKKSRERNCGDIMQAHKDYVENKADKIIFRISADKTFRRTFQAISLNEIIEKALDNFVFQIN